MFVRVIICGQIPLVTAPMTVTGTLVDPLPQSWLATTSGMASPAQLVNARRGIESQRAQARRRRHDDDRVNAVVPGPAVESRFQA